jgi:hypothetical protein
MPVSFMKPLVKSTLPFIEAVLLKIEVSVQE